MKINSTIKELLKMDIDIDVADDYDERCMIAFCGPSELTPIGLEKFGELMEYKVELIFNGEYEKWAVIHCDTGKQASKVQKLFDSLAGYCADSDYSKWFVE